MSDIDFQNGLTCGLTLKGLTKANISLDFLNDHVYRYITDTYNVTSIANGLIPSDAVTTKSQTPVQDTWTDTWDITGVVADIFNAMNDSAQGVIT